MEIEFPRKMNFLLTEPARLKVLYGGRGAGKTENIARALIILAMRRKLRIACFRELQGSIEESVKATIEEWIETLGFADSFAIKDKTIVCKRTGSEFLFLGLRYNINKIKSLARIDIAWVEEANNVSKTSWDKLIPTIRGRSEGDAKGMGGPFGLGPEIWISFNPELEDDETYKRFVITKLPEYEPELSSEDKLWLIKHSMRNGDIVGVSSEEDQKICNRIRASRYSIVSKVNWSDNKWFPPDLRREMNVLKNTDETSWLNVWEGHCKQVLDGAIFAKEIKQLYLDNRVGKVPYDSSRPVFTFWDLGHSDHTAIWFIQRVGMWYNVINYYQNHLEKIGHYLEVLQEFKYAYGAHYLPHDGDAETLASRSIASIVRQHVKEAKIPVKVVPRVIRKVIGINAARTVFPLCNFDEENTSDGLQCLRRYTYKVDPENNKFSKEPDHNEFSHGADAWLTFAMSLKSETATKDKVKKPDLLNNVVPLHGSATGWMMG